MPSHMIHIKIACDINKKLKLDNDALMLGSVLPDLTNNRRHILSHFQKINDEYYRLANYYQFIKEYKDTLNNPISVGYLIHLLTDRYYSYRFYQKYFDFKDRRPDKLKKEYEHIANLKHFKRQIYMPYDKYLLSHGYIEKFSNENIINQIPNYQEITFDKRFLKNYMQKHNKTVDKYLTEKNKNLSVENKEYFDDLYDSCLNYILEYLKYELNIPNE